MGRMGVFTESEGVRDCEPFWHKTGENGGVDVYFLVVLFSVAYLIRLIRLDG